MIEFTSWEDPVIGLEVKPFNWRLRKAREARGWSRAELARRTGVFPSAVGDAEKLRHVSANIREKLALCLEIPEDELFPGVIDALPKGGPGLIEIPFEAEQVERWLTNGSFEPIEQVVNHEAMRQEIAAALETLQPRERRILELRFGLNDGRARTYHDVAHEFGLSNARAQQIEAEALRKLRRSPASAHLREFVAPPEQDKAPAVEVIPTAIPRRHAKQTVVAPSPPPQAPKPKPASLLSWLVDRSTNPYVPTHVSGIARVAMQSPCCYELATMRGLAAHIRATHAPPQEFWPVFEDCVEDFRAWERSRKTGRAS